MRIIPVLDLKQGHAVHARAGDRAQYLPVRSVLARNDGDAVEIARAFHDELSLHELYVADLDAITGAGVQVALLEVLGGVGLKVWLDAGIQRAGDLVAIARYSPARIVVGSETLASRRELSLIVAEHGSRIVFSLDLRANRVVSSAEDIHGCSILEAVAAAVDSGVQSVIVLELTRVGTDNGPDLSRLAIIRNAHPELELIAGGGIRDATDIAQLAMVGCDAALIATALHSGRLTRVAITRALGHG